MTARRAALPSTLWVRQPSWWIVTIAGSLTVFFLVAIVREVVHSYTVRQQVTRLRQQVASQEQRQNQLQDLLDYLASPTFQERQARLNLGLKKSGERVVIVPGPAESSADALAANSSTTSVTPPVAWWRYFFSPKKASSTT